ncbi:hypothetical protein D3C76_1291940 [compost metagenome]|nr:hypothetical protein [Pseudomonas sp.]
MALAEAFDELAVILGQPGHWPTVEVEANSISLIEVVMQKRTPVVLYPNAGTTVNGDSAALA